MAGEGTMFILFPMLPIELRRKIWGHAIKERIIEIRWNHRLDHYYSTTPIPGILHASREARIEGLNMYELLEMRSDMKNVVDDAGNKVPSDENGEAVEYIERNASDTLVYHFGRPTGNERLVFVKFRTYINYTYDTLYFSNNHLLPNYLIGDSPMWIFIAMLDEPFKIQHLAMTTKGTYEEELAQALRNCKSLFSLTFVYEDTCCRSTALHHYTNNHKEAVSFERISDQKKLKHYEKKASKYMRSVMSELPDMPYLGQVMSEILGDGKEEPGFKVRSILREE
jgi:2EXR family